MDIKNITIGSDTTAGSVVADINSNFGKVNVEMEKYKTNLYNKGSYKDAAALTAAIPSPKVGDFANVGGLKYECQTAGTWTNTNIAITISTTDIASSFGTSDTKAVSQNLFSETITALEQEQIQGGVYDVSAHNNGAVFESLSALLGSANLSTLIPTSIRHGGMSIRFIQGSVPSSDNKYVQYRLMSDTFNTTPANWQGVDDEPTAGSDSLVKSGGVYNKTMAPQQTSLFNKNPVAPNYNDVIVSGVSTFDLYKSILYAKIVEVAEYNVNRTYSIGYMEYGELKSDQRRSFRIILKEYNPTTNTWERSSIEVQNYDILPIGTLDNAIYHISTVNKSFKAEFIIDFSCMTFGQSVTLDGGWSGVPKFIMNNKWVDAVEIENLNIHSSEDFNCFRKRLPNSINTVFYGKGGSSDVNNYMCFDIFRSILSLKLYDFDEGLYGLRYIARGETETLKYRVILVKYNESNNTWEDVFDTENMLALEQEQGNSIITIDKTISNKRMIMEIDFNFTPSIGFYASLYARGAAPQFVIKQDCFVAKQSSETVADFIQNLPVSDGSAISSGYAYIDSATYNVKVKQ